MKYRWHGQQGFEPSTLDLSSQSGAYMTSQPRQPLKVTTLCHALKLLRRTFSEWGLGVSGYPKGSWLDAGHQVVYKILLEYSL